MLMQVSELSGVALDWAVAKAEGCTDFRYDTIATFWVTLNGKDRALSKGWAQSFTPSTDWNEGGQIIDRIEGFALKVWLDSLPESKCQAEIHTHEGYWIAFGHTPLIAAMRCYVESKIGIEVDVPNSLLKK